MAGLWTIGYEQLWPDALFAELEVGAGSGVRGGPANVNGGWVGVSEVPRRQRGDAVS